MNKIVLITVTAIILSCSCGRNAGKERVVCKINCAYTIMDENDSDRIDLSASYLFLLCQLVNDTKDTIVWHRCSYNAKDTLYMPQCLLTNGQLVCLWSENDYFTNKVILPQESFYFELVIDAEHLKSVAEYDSLANVIGCFEYPMLQATHNKTFLFERDVDYKIIHHVPTCWELADGLRSIVPIEDIIAKQ